MARLKPRDVNYLAFEGGGGKGVTFLGVIQTLESHGILPIKISFDSSVENKVKGLAGASAGAITALFLCMGLKSTDIETELSQRAEFEAFLDKPLTNYNRSVIGDIATWDERKLSDDPINILNLKVVKAYLTHYQEIAAPILFSALGFGETKDPIARQLKKYPIGYFINLVRDRGIFPGFEVRKYFESRINKFITSIKDKYEPKSDYAKNLIGRFGLSYKTFTFGILEDITNVKLAFTGTNVTSRQLEYFSSDYTPNFPVGEAVAISMNLPILFKPVTVHYNVHLNDVNGRKRYRGEWVDGGLLNNLPMHYFDDLEALTARKRGIPQPDYSKPLNRNMLAFRLTPPVKERPERTLNILRSYLEDLVETILSPSEKGQIRTKEEMDQTIDLDTGELETTEFAPGPEKSSKPIADARQTLERYFSSKV